MTQLLTLGALLLPLILMRRSGKAAKAPAKMVEEHKWGAPMKLSDNFELSEFLHSEGVSKLPGYKLTDSELANVLKLAKLVLQPAREKFGKLIIWGGGRPESVLADDGKTIVAKLQERGYAPTTHGDHEIFAAADVVPEDASKVPELANFFRTLPDVRQVIVYYKTIDGKKTPSRVHVAVKNPVRPKNAKRFAFAILDGKDVGDLV